METTTAKRKRPAEKKGDAAEGRRKKGDSSASAVTVTVAPPTEEEVEEFFAILRRMHVAVKYFEKSKSDGKAHDPTTENWRSALETAEPFEGIDGGGGGVDDVNEKLKGGERVEESRVLDLNATPDDDDETESN